MARPRKKPRTQSLGPICFGSLFALIRWAVAALPLASFKVIVQALKLFDDLPVTALFSGFRRWNDRTDQPSNDRQNNEHNDKQLPKSHETFPCTLEG